MNPTVPGRGDTLAPTTAADAVNSDRGRNTPPEADDRPADPYQVKAKQLLKARSLWTIPAIVGSIVLVLMTVFYVGSVVNPLGHLRGLPVSIVNEDSGAAAGSQRVNFGARLQSGLTGSHTVSTLLSLTPQRLPAAEDRMNHNGAYATLVIPANFTASLLSLAGVQVPPGASAAKPTVQLLTNQRAGTVGVELASGVLQPAVAQASRVIGRQLLAATRPTPTAGSATAAELADPLTLQAVDYRPLPSHSALGLSAFYVALLALMCGFLAATIINATVDAATGYATTDFGPKWTQRAPLPINRWQTLLTKWAMALPLTALVTGLMLFVAIVLLNMNAPHAGLLWLFAWLCAASVAAGTLVLFAALGTQGQLIAVLLFVYLGLASAGGTVPIQALPSPLKLVSEIEPLRQILAGTRSILYFNANGPAGLTRGFTTATAGLIFWLALGATVVRWYDRKGLHRLRPDLLAYVQESIGAYRAQAQRQSSARADAEQASEAEGAGMTPSPTGEIGAAPASPGSDG
jgi:YhgE/Pip-like protein